MTLLDVHDLRLEISNRVRTRKIIDGVSFCVAKGEALGLVGESGCGKSMTARSLMGLLPPGARLEGEILFEGDDVVHMSQPELRAYRASKVAMIFQDPRAHTNPVRSIGDFLTEAQCEVGGVKRSVARRRAIELLASVGIPDGEYRLSQYPHQLSGGLLQRVMIASALASDPALLLADEPTTALDVTTQAEVMVILGRLRREHEVALLFITHNLELAAATCDRTAVMYAGRIVEVQQSSALHDRPLHPYTAGLLCSRPSIEHAERRLMVIPGRPVAAYDVDDGCAFAPRCAYAEPRCRRERPMVEALDEAVVACHRAVELRGSLPTGYVEAVS